MVTTWAIAKTEADQLTLPKNIARRPLVEGFTIDGSTSKDLDDAIWGVETDEGATLFIHIADVSEVVVPGSAVNSVAMERTQTSYLRRGNKPMIPHALSENLLSLLPRQQRPTLTVAISLDHDAEIQKTLIYETRLISDKQFSYESADKACGDPSSPYYGQLQLCQRWAKKLNQHREENGAFGGMRGAGGSIVDEEGRILISPRGSFHSQVVIMEFMILANRAVAQWCAERDLPILYRNHTAKAIAPERQDLLQSLFTSGSAEMMRRKLQSWLNRADYGPTLIGHFALNLTAYTHFTSPIRRIADLINHRIIKAALRGQRPPYLTESLTQISAYIKAVNQDAVDKKQSFFKARAKQELSVQLADTANYANLPAKEFSQILHHGIREGRVATLTGEVQRRLMNRTITVNDLFRLILENDNHNLQALAIEALERHPCDGPSILAIASNVLPGWDPPVFIQDQIGDFVCWVVANINGESFTSPKPGRGSRKQTAKQQGCITWLKAYVDGSLVAPQKRPEVTPKAPQSEPSVKRQKERHPSLSNHLKDGQNFVGLLGELCQYHQWPLPSYRLLASHDGFIGLCSGKAGGLGYEGEGFGSKKKTAKQLAAREALAFLQENID